ncbi:MAG: hypothetical protein KJ666_05735 [Bacteroidetes bacterium]|nr:hypothetical protein [Bacteroidota bacterium]
MMQVSKPSLSKDFNLNLKKSIKRNLIVKNIFNVTVKSFFKSLATFFEIFLILFGTKRNNKEHHLDK